MKDLNREELKEQIALHRDRVETMKRYISDTQDSFTRSNMEVQLTRYNSTLNALIQELQSLESMVDNNTNINLENFQFNSSDHLRHENGIHVSGPHGGAPRIIKIENNISGGRGYSVTVLASDGNQPEVQLVPKQMRIVSSDESKIVLKGFGTDTLGQNCADYGLSIYHSDAKIEKCVMHWHDRNIDIEYLKDIDNTVNKTMDKQQFANEWKNAFDVRAEIMKANTMQEAESIFNSHKIHPLTLYGRVYKALTFENKSIVNNSMEMVLKFINKPFPNIYFTSSCNDPIGEIMLTPIIKYPLEVAPVNDPNVLKYLNWILVGYTYLFQSFKQIDLQAYDSLRTIAIAIEQNSDDFAAIIFGGYLKRPNYALDYTKFLVFCLSSAGLGFQKHGNNINEFNNLINEANRYSSWLQSKDPTKDLGDFIDEGKEIATILFESVINDIKSRKISLNNLKPISV